MLALATIRRILLELEHALQPEATGTLVGPLELWMHQPRAELGGQSPLQALATANGEARVRLGLQRRLRVRLRRPEAQFAVGRVRSKSRQRRSHVAYPVASRQSTFPEDGRLSATGEDRIHL